MRTEHNNLREAIALRLKAGMAYRAIMKELHTTPATIASVAKERGMRRRHIKEHDWAAIQDYLDSGHTMAETQQKFGFTGKQYERALRFGLVFTADTGKVIEAYISEPWNTRSKSVARLLSSGALEPICCMCGIKVWRGRPVALELAHRSGDVSDNRLENLALMCPNCFAQTKEAVGLGRAPR